MENASTKAISVAAISAIAIFGAVQLMLLIYSFSHPSMSKWVTVSFLISIVLYPMVIEYHDKRLKAGKGRSHT